LQSTGTSRDKLLLEKCRVKVWKIGRRLMLSPGVSTLVTSLCGALVGARNELASQSNLIHNSTMAWTFLIIAGILEIGWAIGLKYTEGFSRLWPSVATLGAMIVSIALLSVALKTIPVGTGYAVWTGIGAAGTAIIGMVFLGESRETLRMLCILLIIAGVLGLKFVPVTKL
jgi:quaternary ammonium compound-resistance protein SugE